ncbi:reverse transcriptase domain-containing protein [Tanacetum coccineum]|uniref:Reverse transcriptase domain-containing protein n=1 Tax=Tanacetum coccineum TaxID=301880 RepID=A0ABQ5CMD1_9ASTR
MSPRVMTRSAGRPTAESLGGGTGERVGRGGKGRRLREANDKRVDELNEPLTRHASSGCSYKEFLACNPKEYDGKGGVVVLTRWIEKMENIQDTSCCSNDQKLNTLLVHLVFLSESHGDENLESLELWNHAMVRAGHATYTDRFHELARLVSHLVTPKSRMIERKLRKEEMWRETSKDKNGRDDNKRTRTGNVIATTVKTPIGRENMVTWSKYTTYNSYHAPGGPCRTCFNCYRSGHLAKDYRGVPRNVNPINAKNLTVRACYECGSTDHVWSACPRLNGATRTRKKIVQIKFAANNGGQGRGNQGNQARGRAFMLGAEEAR